MSETRKAHKVAFLGLGVMGYPMAGHLAKAGHSVCVYNRTGDKAERWVKEYGGSRADTPAAAAEGAEFVFACVGADDDVRQVTIGKDGAFSTMDHGRIFVDHTTASADVAKELYEAATQADLHFLDAPVSGGQVGAENGALTVMVGGDDGPYHDAESLIQSFAGKVQRMGGAGAGQMTKMVNQICIAGLVEGLAEALNFAMEAGLDANAVVDVISKGAAQSWQMENRARTMIAGEYDFGFAVDLMRKDLDIALNEAGRLGVELPVTKVVDQFYADVQQMGGGRNDTSSLLRRYRNS